MTRFLILMFCIAVHTAAISQRPYAVSNINPELLKNADMVKRSETMVYEMFSTRRAVLKNKYAITILNDKADYFAVLTEHYDKLQSITNIEGTLYDGTGKVLKKVKNRDIHDMSASDGISLAHDNRAKLHSFHHKTYPYTVEYEVETVLNHTFWIPGWYAQEAEHLSVESASFEVITPADYQLRYRANNYAAAPQKISSGGRTFYTWQIKNVAAIRKEYAGPKWQDLTTVINVAPTAFELEGYKGNMSSWKEFGSFLYELTKQRDALPDDIKQKVASLTAGITDEKKKIEVLYNFLQQNTRYISIQLGIGGWQPFEAAYVAQKGYGDCKALSNYMYSLLKEAGITSKYALIYAGAGQSMMAEDFPSNQFNHAILCVPLKKDTVWLECTSQTVPAGYMGSFTGNRKALLIDENGGVLVSTPSYGSQQNTQSRKAVGKIADDGFLQVSVETRYKGLQQDDYHHMIHGLSKEKLKERLQEMFELPTYEVNSFNYQEVRSSLPEIIETIDISVSGYATVTGKRLFLMPNLLNKSKLRLSEEELRKSPINLENSFLNTDTVEIDIPGGYEVETIPQQVSIKGKFGTYEAAASVKDNKIIYTRRREVQKSTYPASEYSALVKFFNDVYKADRSKIVLVKKELPVTEKKPF